MKTNILKSIFVMAIMFFAISVNAENSVFIKSFNFDKGMMEKKVAVNLTNDRTFTAFQFDLFLPAGLSIKSDEYDYILELGRLNGRTHALSCAQQTNGCYRFLCYSLKNADITGNEGALFYITIVADNKFSGSGDLTIKNALLVTAAEQEVKPEETTATVMDFTTGIEETLTDVDENAEYYNLQGIKVAKEDLNQGIYIKKQGEKTQKVIIK